MTGSAETSLGLKWTVSFELLLGEKIREGGPGGGWASGRAGSEAGGFPKWLQNIVNSSVS